MPAHAWTTLATLLVVMGLLCFTRAAAYLVLLAGLTFLLTVGVIDEVGNILIWPEGREG